MLLQLGQFTEARTTFNKLLRVFQGTTHNKLAAGAAWGLVLSAIALGEESAQLMRNAIGYENRSVGVSILRYFLFETDDVERARRGYQRILDNTKPDTDANRAYLNVVRGHLERLNANYGNAIQYYEIALASRALFFDFHEYYGLGSSQLAKGSYERDMLLVEIAQENLEWTTRLAPYFELAREKLLQARESLAREEHPAPVRRSARPSTSAGTAAQLSQSSDSASLASNSDSDSHRPHGKGRAVRVSASSSRSDSGSGSGSGSARPHGKGHAIRLSASSSDQSSNRQASRSVSDLRYDEHLARGFGQAGLYGMNAVSDTVFIVINIFRDLGDGASYLIRRKTLSKRFENESLLRASSLGSVGHAVERWFFCMACVISAPLGSRGASFREDILLRFDPEGGRYTPLANHARDTSHPLLRLYAEDDEQVAYHRFPASGDDLTVVNAIPDRKKRHALLIQTIRYCLDEFEHFFRFTFHTVLCSLGLEAQSHDFILLKTELTNLYADIKHLLNDRLLERDRWQEIEPLLCRLLNAADHLIKAIVELDGPGQIFVFRTIWLEIFRFSLSVDILHTLYQEFDLSSRGNLRLDRACDQLQDHIVSLLRHCVTQNIHQPRLFSALYDLSHSDQPGPSLFQPAPAVHEVPIDSEGDGEAAVRDFLHNFQRAA